jgi:hypothetical protein
MERFSHELETPFRRFLASVVADRGRHARFLNMLSLMEHIGSRKIMLSQTHGVLGAETLKHLAEETRHAYFFKLNAEKVAGRVLEGYPGGETLCRGAAAMYIGRLDAEAKRNVEAPSFSEALYKWVSLIIELRANWVYGLYQEELEKAGSPVSLKSVIAEEVQHLEAMAGQLQDDGEAWRRDLARLTGVESGLFQRFWSQLQKALA